MNWKKRLTYELYRLQQKVAMTRHEAYAMAWILGLLLLGTLVKSIQKNTLLFDPNIYAETDSLFAAATREMKKKESLPDSSHIPALNSPESTATLKEVFFYNGKVSINTATQSELETLPRIGPAMAQRIIEYRQIHGSFTSAEDLLLVKGIGPKTLDRLRDNITLTP